MPLPTVYLAVFTSDPLYIAGVDYAQLGVVAPLPMGGFSPAEIAANAGAWGAYAAGKYGSLPAGTRVYLDLETLVREEATSAEIASLIEETKVALPQCEIVTYFVNVTDFGAVTHSREAEIEALNNALASSIGAAGVLGPDWYQVEWSPAPTTADLEWNANECIRVRAGKPMAPFLSVRHATGGGLTTAEEFLAQLRALRRVNITELTLWASILTEEDGTAFVAQVPVLGLAIRSVWGDRVGRMHVGVGLGF